MESQHNYWKSRYQTLEKEFFQLKSEHMQLKLMYQHAIEGSLHDINQISALKIENEQLKKTIKELFAGFETKTPKENNDIPTLKPYLSHLNLFSPQKKIGNSNDEYPGTIKQALPDQSISFECNDPSLYISFLVIGVPTEKLGDDTHFPPEILFEFPENSSQLSTEIRKILSDCCFPSGIEVKPMNLSGSASELNSLLYGQTPNKRNSNCYIFTLKSNQTEKEHSDMPNSNQELLYLVCLEIEDMTTNKEQE